MDLLKSMNRALKYIEENLTNDIDFQEAAKLACRCMASSQAVRFLRHIRA